MSKKQTAIVSAVVTILVISAFAATFVAGMKYQASNDQAVQSKIEAAVKSAK